MTELALPLFVNPYPISYNSGGSSIVVVNSYTDIFLHVEPIHCNVLSCILTTGISCGTALSQTDLVVGATPYSVSATELNPLGYTH